MNFEDYFTIFFLAITLGLVLVLSFKPKFTYDNRNQTQNQETQESI
jgi:hypothetical protein